jgi:RHS repeat-associated protein
MLATLLLSVLPAAPLRAQPRPERTGDSAATPAADRALDRQADAAGRAPVAESRTLVPSGAAWRYLAAGAPPAGWRAPGFDAAAWPSGVTPFDSQAGAATRLQLPPTPTATPVAYLRHAFTLDEPAQYTQLLLRSLRLTDSIVSLNGIEIFRNMRSSSRPAANDGALDVASRRSYEEANVALNLLRRGVNVVAVELYAHGQSPEGLRFDLELIGATGGLALRPTPSIQPQVVGTPSLQAQALPTTPGIAGGFSSRACESQIQDVMLVIDRSGSMSNGPIDDAKSAAKSFISQLDLAIDQVGLVSFADTARLDYALTTNGGAVRSAIGSLVASGGTAIGAGINAAQAQLSAGARSGSQPIMVVLSDGQSGDNPIGAANAAKAAGTRIISIALGSADTATMSAIASSPSDYYYASTSDGLSDNYLWAGDTLRCQGEGFKPEPNYNPKPCDPISSGDPINLTDGSWYTRIPCLSLGGKGLPISVDLEYSTRLWFEGRGASNIGRGWTFGYGRRLVYDGVAGKATLFLETGEKFTYPEPSSGSFTAPAGVFMAVTRNDATGEMTLTYRDGTKDVFRVDGSLAYTQDRFGNQTLVSFNATTGVLTITNNRTNQAILLEHTLATDPDTSQQVWKLQRITDAPGNGGAPRTIDLAYTGGRLTKVTDAGGAVYTFGYDAEGRIDTAYDRNNDPSALGSAAVAMVNTYAASSTGTPYKVARQTLANGTTIDVNWNTGSTAYDLAVTYNAGRADQRTVRYLHRSSGANPGSLTRVYNPNSTGGYTAMEYDSDGLLTKVVDPAGHRTDYRYNASGDLTEVRAYKTATTFDRTQMQYDNYGNRTRLEEPAGAVTRWTYNATTGAPLTGVREAVINGVATTQTTTFETNSYGQITAIQLPDGAWDTQAYDGRGYPATATYDANYGGNTGRLAITESTSYDWRGFLTSSTNAQGIQTTYEYATSAGNFGNLGWQSAVVIDSAPGGRAVRVEYTYDKVGNTTRMIEDAGAGRLNATWTYVYALVGADGGYELIRATDPLNQAVEIAYTAYGDELRVRELSPQPGQAQRVTSFGYTPEGWLQQVALDDDRVVQRNSYSPAGQVIASADARDVTTGYTYDAKGRLSTVSTVNPRATNLALGQPATQSSTYSIATADFAVDGNVNGNYFAGSVSHTGLQAAPWWQVDLGSSQPIGVIDLWNRLDCCSDRLSNFYVFVSDTPFTSNDPTTTVNQAGVAAYYIAGQAPAFSSIDINRAGRYVRVQLTGANSLQLAEVQVWSPAAVAADQPLVSYTYDAHDRVTQVAERVSSTVSRTVIERSYDTLNRLISERNGAADQTDYAYDAQRNWLTLMTVGSNNAAQQLQTQYSYDAVGRLTQQIVDPGGQNLTSSFFYTAPGSSDRWNLRRMVDPRQFATAYSYNSLGLLERTTDATQPTGAATTYTYNNQAALTAVTPAAGAASVYAVDLLGRATSLTRGGQVERWAYHVDGSLASYTDFANRVTTYSYDRTGRLETIDRAGANADASFTYTDNDLLASATSKPNGTTSETTSYGYDAFNRLQTRERDGRTVSYGYNLDDTLNTISYWNRGDVTYGYDAASRVNSINPWSAGATSFTYRSTNLLNNITRPSANGVVTSFSYDSASRLSGITHQRGTATPLQELQYVLDSNGNVVQQTDVTQMAGNTAVQSLVTNYSYNALNQLTGVTYPALANGPDTSSVNYGYDPTGNRTAATTVNMTAPLTGPAWSDAAAWNSPQYFRTIGYPDLNGDAKEDICGRGGAGVSCFLSDGSGFPTAVTGPAWSDAASWNQPQYYLTIGYADVNGDGNEDVCGRGTAGVSCFLSDGSGFPTAVTGPAWSDADGWTAAKYYETIRYPDVNGDGKADVCGRNNGGIVCALSDGSGFPTIVAGPAWSDADGWGAFQYYDTIRYPDINGDGKDDVCARGVDGVSCFLSDGSGFPTAVAGPPWSDAGGWGSPEYYRTIRFADVNGDGKDDACARSGIGIECYLSNGSGFPTVIDGPAWSDADGWNAPQYYTTIRMPDINGDDRADICILNGVQVSCHLSDGSGFSTLVNGPAWSGAAGWNLAASYATVRYPDLDGDGDQDVCSRATTGITCGVTALSASAASYDASDRITSAGYSYDASGNLLSDGATTYSYDAADRLIRTVKGTLTTDYFYDALGNLVRQTQTSGGTSTTTSYVLDELDELPLVIGEVRSDGSETLYAYGPQGLTTRRDILAGGGTNTSYPLLDALGSVRHLTRAADGALRQSVVYDAWGVIRQTTGNSPAGGVGLRNGPGFTGELQRDDGTIHLRARVYQPQLGRFLQRDDVAGALGQPLSHNRYSYVENNPVNWVDPSGMFRVPLWQRIAQGASQALKSVAPILSKAAPLLRGASAAAGVVAEAVFAQPAAAPTLPPHLREPTVGAKPREPKTPRPPSTAPGAPPDIQVPHDPDDLYMPDGRPGQPARGGGVKPLPNSSVRLKRLMDKHGLPCPPTKGDPDDDQDKWDYHHLIPKSFRLKPIGQQAMRGGFDFDQHYNGIALPSDRRTSLKYGLPSHEDNHPVTTRRANEAVNAIAERARQEKWNENQVAQAFFALTRQLEAEIRALGPVRLP